MARAGYGSEQVNPGILLVEKLYNYIQARRSGSRGVETAACRLAAPCQLPSLRPGCPSLHPCPRRRRAPALAAPSLQKHHGGHTKVMASGLRTKAEALSLAGCDFLVVVSGSILCVLHSVHLYPPTRQLLLLSLVGCDFLAVARGRDARALELPRRCRCRRRPRCGGGCCPLCATRALAIAHISVYACSTHPGLCLTNVLLVPVLPRLQGPKVLTALNSATTLDGYNTG